MKKILLVVCVVLFASSFTVEKSISDSLSHRGTKSVAVTSINFKEFVLDGTGTSLWENWQMDVGKLQELS
jgi:galactitol-specific phosphotransferase system IIB component